VLIIIMSLITRGKAKAESEDYFEELQK